MSSGEPYNPLARQNLGASVAEALLSRNAERLASPKAFSGAGIYAIYYSGPFPEYEPIAKRNRGSRFEAPNQGKRPRWDVIHPGREWATRCAERQETSKQILADVEEHLRSQPIPTNPHFFVMQAGANYDLG